MFDYRLLNAKDFGVPQNRERFIMIGNRIGIKPVEQRWQLLDEYLQQYPCINRSQYARLAGRSYKQAVVDLNRFIEEGVLMRHGMGPSVVYARKR